MKNKPNRHELRATRKLTSTRVQRMAVRKAYREALLDLLGGGVRKVDPLDELTRTSQIAGEYA